MAFKAGSIEGDIYLDNSQARAALEGTVKEAQQFKGRMDREMKGASDSASKGWKGFFNDLKGEFGKASLLGQSTKLLAGGGVVAGLGLATRQLRAWGDTMAEVSVQLRTNQITGGQAAGRLAESLPVVGDAFKFGQDLREIITGEGAAQARLATAIEATSRAQALDLKHTMDLVNARRLEAEATKNAELALNQLGTAYERAGKWSGMPEPGRSYAQVEAHVNDAFAEQMRTKGISDKDLKDAKDRLGQANDTLSAAWDKHRDVALHDPNKIISGWKDENLETARRGVSTAQADLGRIEADREKVARDRDRAIAAGKKAVDAENENAFWDEREKQERADRDRMRNMGLDLTKELESPEQKYQRGLKNALDLYSAGYIDETTLGRAAMQSQGESPVAQSVKGEEVFGPRVVTTADGQAPLNTIAGSTQQTAALLRQVVQLLGRPDAPPVEVNIQ